MEWPLQWNTSINMPRFSEVPSRSIKKIAIISGSGGPKSQYMQLKEVCANLEHLNFSGLLKSKN